MISSPPVSACLLSWRRPGNLRPIVEALGRLDFIDEILVWNNDPEVRLELPGEKVRVLSAARNEGCYGRFLCAREARNEVVYVQDDDVLVQNVPEIYRLFGRDPSRIAHALGPKHFAGRARQYHGDCHVALLGWGAFFRREWVGVLDELPRSVRESALFIREADKYFSILLERHHQTVLGRLHHLPGHAQPGQALWLEPDHQLLKALAVREALALVRNRRAAPLPVPWHVVIPCHDSGGHLREAVRSVLHNDADYVVTVVDDASDDETPEVGRELSARYPHVMYRRLDDRVGPAAAVNRAIAAVDSIFVVRLDADDRIGPDYLFEAGRVLTRGADVANPDAILLGPESSRWPAPDDTTLPMLLRRNPVHYVSAFRRGCWAQVGGYDERMSGWEDYELWIRMASGGARIRKVAGDHFYHRRRGLPRESPSAEQQDSLRAYIQAKHRALFQPG